MNQFKMGKLWASSFSDSLQYINGDESVIYYQPSGSLHLINALGMRVLKALETPRTIDDLIQTLDIHYLPMLTDVGDFLTFAIEEGLVIQIEE